MNDKKNYKNIMQSKSKKLWANLAIAEPRAAVLTDQNVANHVKVWDISVIKY